MVLHALKQNREAMARKRVRYFIWNALLELKDQ